MRINVIISTAGGVSCEEQKCRFRKECANHSTAGDFRTEDGFSPELFEENGVFYCRTKSSKEGDCKYATLPVEYDSMDRGAVVFRNGSFVSYGELHDSLGERDECDSES